MTLGTPEMSDICLEEGPCTHSVRLLARIEFLYLCHSALVCEAASDGQPYQRLYCSPTVWNRFTLDH